MAGTVFRFARCEVDETAREVRLDGQPRPVEPRPFNLLVHLIRQRDRVVPKEELLERVWPQEAGSLSALARAVMKARQAIGDDGEPALIRTVPRVGYRFVAPLLDDALAPPAAPGLSVVLLPFDNATGDAALDWARLGLMELVARALAEDGRLVPVAGQAFPATPATPDTQASARRTVQGRITREAAGYRLHWQVQGDAQPVEAQARADHVAELGPCMALALLQQMFPGTEPAADTALGYRDPMALEAFARGLHAAAEHQWRPAASLFEAALQLEPEHPAAQLELLRVLSFAGDPSGKRVARRLLARSERENKLPLAAQVHRALGQLHLSRGAIAPAAYRVETALRVGAAQLPDEWTAEALLLQASVSVHLRQFDAAGRSLDSLLQLPAHRGHHPPPLAAQNLRALIQSKRGDIEGAARRSAELVRHSRALRAHCDLMDACANAMADLTELGRLQEAATFGEEGFGCAMSLGDWHRASGIAPSLAWLYRLTRAPQALEHLVTMLGEPEALPRPDGAWTARAHLAACRGRHDEASRCLQQAMARLRESCNALHEHLTLPWLLDALIRSDRTHEAEAELARASQPPYADDPVLASQLLYYRAHLAHATGEPRAALALLHRLIDAGATPLWHGWALISAAWLQAEASRSEQAGQPLLPAHHLPCP